MRHVINWKVAVCGISAIFLWLPSLLPASRLMASEFIWDHRAADSTALYLVGEIIPGDYERFVAAIKKRGPRPFMLYLRSGGGNAYEAMRIGRLVRQLSIATMGPLSTPRNVHVASCASDVTVIGKLPPCICASACTLIWFAGVMRTSLEIYIHSIKYDSGMFGNLTPTAAQQLYRKGMEDVHAYLREMDVNDKYYYMMTNVASANIQRVFTPYGDDVSGWPPAYREWLYARCGTPIKSNAMSWGRCTVDSGNQATVDAIRTFLATSP
jgi:hypothetical protein